MSGAHLYGFPSVDSDIDLRGAHVAPVDLSTGLDPIDETVKRASVRDGVDVDLVTHEVRRFLTLLLRDNGYVLEQLYSPLIVHTTPEHDELKAHARGCITRGCARHYLGFAHNQWALFAKESPRRVKPLLYVFRVLLSGIHLMRTGDVNASLIECNADARLPFVDDLIARRRAGGEHGTVTDVDLSHYEREYHRLRGCLTAAAERSTLPERCTSRDAIRDFLGRVRQTIVV